jgi:hypothetical protein
MFYSIGLTVRLLSCFAVAIQPRNISLTLPKYRPLIAKLKEHDRVILCFTTQGKPVKKAQSIVIDWQET